MPIRSPRLIYKIDSIVRNLDDTPGQIDIAPTETVDGTTSPIYVKIKKGIADYFGLDPVPSNDPIFTGVFAGEGLNKGSTYRRNIGGYRAGSYKFLAKTTFLIQETYYDSTLNTIIEQTKAFRSMSIGFPLGHSVHEVLAWLDTLQNNDKVIAVVGPSGKQQPYIPPAI